MAGPTKRVAIAAALCAAFLSMVGSSAAAPASTAKVSAAAQRALDEIAAEAGYSSWGVYRGAREAEAAALQKEAARIIADALTYGRRVEKDYGEFDGVSVRGFTEYVIDFEGGQTLLRTGLEFVYPGCLGFGAETVRTTVYWGSGRLEQLGSVTSVIEDGVETVVRVGEFVPGSIDLKPGDSRPAPPASTSAAGTRPSSLDPKPDGSLGRASGGSSPLGGILDAIIAQADRDEQSTSDDSSEGETGSPDEPSSDDPSPDEPSSDSNEKPSIVWGETVTDEDGNTYTAFEKTNDDGTTTMGTKTEHADGTVTCHTVTKDGEQESDCPSGMTDEPTCRSDCERLTYLAALFCDSCDANTTLLAGGPLDFGDPSDPNAEAPLDWGNMFADPRTDGVLDPVSPGEGAEILENAIALAMLGTLRDPANPPGADDEAPPPGGPAPGDDE